MNSDVSFVRAYIVPATSSNSNGNYQRLLNRRQELCNSAKKPSATSVTTFEQTVTFVEQLKRNQHRSITDTTYSTTQITKENNEKKTLTPQELSYQLNLKLEYLIRTRVIERHRVVNRMNNLPTATPVKSKITPRENLNRTSLSYLSKTREKNVVSSSTTTTTNTTIIQDDFIDKDSFGDNDEAFEEMVEEENINFSQQQP